MTAHPSCIFCQIVSGKIPSHRIYEDEHYISFLDIHPITQGHALVVPKAHSQDLLHMHEKDRREMLTVAAKVAPKILSVVKAKGFNIGMNTGADSGQVVFHSHLHIIPRHPNDGLVNWGSNARPNTDLSTLAQKINAKR